jgi:putative DNA primase/helicase
MNKPFDEVASDKEQSKKTVRPNIVCMGDITPRSVRWLWQGRIAAGRISLIVGQPGGGKSFVTCDMAARVSTGTDWPDGSPCDVGCVLFVTAEDDPADTIRPRLDACGADTTRIHLLAGALVRRADGNDDEIMFSLSELRILEEALEHIPDCRLIVIDPIGSFMGGKTDAHRDNEVRSLLAPLAKLAERTGVAVVMVAHNRKSTASSADDTVLGSRAFTGLARSVWHLMRDPEDRHRRYLLAGKSNLAAESEGLAFSISGNPACVHWEEEAVSMSADDGMAAAQAAQQQQTNPKAIDGAIEWLTDRLSRGDEEANSLKNDAERAGHKSRTIDRAAQVVVKRRYRVGGKHGPMWWSTKSVRQENISSPENFLGELTENGELTNEPKH